MSAELEARRTAAAALLAGYRAALASAPLGSPPGREWMLKLAAELGGLLDALEDDAPAVPAGSPGLTPDQVAIVLVALRDAMDYRLGKSVSCPDCDAAELARDPAAACARHQPDMAQAGRYDELGRLLAGEEGQR